MRWRPASLTRQSGLARGVARVAQAGNHATLRINLWALIMLGIERRLSMRWLAMRRGIETSFNQPRQSGSHPERAPTRQPASNPGAQSSADAADGEYAGLDEFEGFFRRYERQVVACLWRITGDEQAAHDLSQETFLRAWRHFKQIRDYEQPGAWLLRVATNLALNHLRQRGSPVRSAEPLGGSGNAGEGDDSGDWRNALASSDPSMRFIERDLVQQTLLELSPQQRVALVLREVYGFTCEEIGRALGTSRDAIKMTLYRGREQFRLHYLRKGGRQ